MFTVLWKIGNDNEEIYSAPSVVLVPRHESAPSDQLDCRGERHVAFMKLTPVEDDSSGLHLVRTVINFGEVFVMNEAGKTVAMYRFGRNQVGDDTIPRAA